MSDIHIRGMVGPDWSGVKDVYATGIETGHATFESAPPAAWDDFCASRRLDLCLVAVDGDSQILGWVGAGPVSSRNVYRGVVEHSIYVDPDASGKGVGSRLLSEFMSVADRLGIWTIQSPRRSRRSEASPVACSPNRYRAAHTHGSVPRS